MGLVSVTLPNDGETIEAADYNDPINAILDEFNGNIEAANIAADAITTIKVADNAITDDKLDYPRFWQEIGRTTLGANGDTISVTSLPARKYLQLRVSLNDQGGAIGAVLYFNNDTATNYAYRISSNGGADSTATTNAGVQLNVSGGAAQSYLIVVDIINIETEAKLVIAETIEESTSGAGTAPGRRETVGKWQNVLNQISRVDIVNASAGNYASGSEVVVLGHD